MATTTADAAEKTIVCQKASSAPWQHGSGCGSRKASGVSQWRDSAARGMRMQDLCFGHTGTVSQRAVVAGGRWLYGGAAELAAAGSKYVARSGGGSTLQTMLKGCSGPL